MNNFKPLSEKKNVPQKQLLKLVDGLADAYKRIDIKDSYSTTIGGKVVTVTPSQELATEVKTIIANV